VSCLEQWVEAVRAGVPPEKATKLMVRAWQDPPRVAAVVRVLERYGHDSWARERGRNLCAPLMLGEDMTVDEAHGLLSRVVVAGRLEHYVIPREAAEEALRAWALGEDEAA
jgi:hypothetical protein